MLTTWVPLAGRLLSQMDLLMLPVRRSVFNHSSSNAVSGNGVGPVFDRKHNLKTFFLVSFNVSSFALFPSHQALAEALGTTKRQSCCVAYRDWRLGGCGIESALAVRVG